MEAKAHRPDDITAMVEPLAEPAKKRRRTSALEAIAQDGGSCPSTAQDIGPHNNDQVDIINCLHRFLG